MLVRTTLKYDNFLMMNAMVKVAMPSIAILHSVSLFVNHFVSVYQHTAPELSLLKDPFKGSILKISPFLKTFWADGFWWNFTPIGRFLVVIKVDANVLWAFSLVCQLGQLGGLGQPGQPGQLGQPGGHPSWCKCSAGILSGMSTAPGAHLDAALMFRGNPSQE